MVAPTTSETLTGKEPREVAIPLLVESHGGMLFALGSRVCGSREEAEDLVQETFLQAYRKWDQFEGRSSASTWLYTIASRLCQRMHRKRTDEPDHLLSLEELLPFGDLELAVAPAEGLSSAIREEGKQRVEQAIAGLSQEFRMPLVLKELAGLPLKEIAIIMEIPEATVKTRLHRARLQVRHALEGVLPKAEVPQAIFSKRICMDLLQAKQETLDNGTAFEFPGQVICERCAEIFATMDLGLSICREIAAGELPAGFYEQLTAQLSSEA